MKIFISIITALFCIHAIYAQPAGYGYGKAITIQAAQVSGTGSHTDFPVLISFTDTDLRTVANSGRVENSSGYDIIFTTTSCGVVSQLSHQIETYVASTGEYAAWVKIPTLSTSANTMIFMYYGNSSVSIDPSTTAVWSNGYEGVYTLHNDLLDKSGNANNATNVGSTDFPNSIIADGQDFDGVNDRLDIGNIANLKSATAITMSCWANPDAFSSFDGFVTNFSSNSNNMGLALGGGAFGTTQDVICGLSNGSLTVGYTTGGVFTAANWYYITLVFDGSLAGNANRAKIYLNGVQQSLTFFGTIPATTNNNANGFEIGRYQLNNSICINAQLDQVTMASAARSSGWVATEYNNQNTPSSFYTVTAEMTAAALCLALSVNLLSFQAKVIENTSVKLDWVTASEINNDYFTVLRSKHGIEWETVATVNGSGNSSQLINYSSVDENPHSGISYYKLKTTDINGQAEYSKIVAVDITNAQENKIMMYPNPANNQVIIEANKAELAHISFFNLIGQDISNSIQIISKTNSKLVIDVSGLSQGAYMVKTKTIAKMLHIAH